MESVTSPSLKNDVPLGENVREAVEAIESCHRDLLSERGAYMNRCRVIREGITAAYDTAKEKGILKKSLRAYVKKRDLERKAAAVAEDLEPDERGHLFLIMKLGGEAGLVGLPLGDSAIAHAQGDTLDRLHS